ncbi:hypothetical protein Syun_012926 [Stephania yunnanensis]|uniref:Uncharacterized protein n=1 Tax=Stephania yunnanensis TaxID=152371 RepID=A0AAP0K0F0_9MAGN
MAFYIGSMRFIDVIEPDNPVRVLRQMGYVQGIPKKPNKPIYADRSNLTHTYSVKYSYSPHVWEEWEHHLISREQRGERTVFPWQAALGYIQWFESVNHQFAENPEHVNGVVDEYEPTLMPKTNVTAENAIAMANAVIAFLSGVEDENEDMVTGTTTHNDRATTSITAIMAP